MRMSVVSHLRMQRDLRTLGASSPLSELASAVHIFGWRAASLSPCFESFLTVMLASEFGFAVMWYFHMAYHGKGIYDPEGGAVKTIIMHLIRRGEVSKASASL